MRSKGRRLTPPASPVYPILSMGYGGRSLDGFLDLLKEHEVTTVADCRWTPHGRGPFGQRRLVPALDAEGVAYCWIRELGNPDHRTATIRVHDMEAGMARLDALARRGPVAMLCVCRDFAKCHTLRVADALLERGVVVRRVDDGRQEELPL